MTMINISSPNGEEGQSDKIIRQFLRGFFDTRTKERKKIKEINLECLKMIEERIAEKPDLERLMSKYKGDAWIRKIFVSYILLRMYHLAISWDDSQPKAKSKKPQYGRHDFFP